MMKQILPIPFIIYWLLVKDFFYDIDVCDSSNNEPGHCLTNSECSYIGTNIGSCDSEPSGSVCCKITLNLFNETYLLKQIFVRKSQTDVMREMRIFSSSGACGQSLLQYGNTSILLKEKKKVIYVPEIHVSETPDRIMWPVYASYSRESRDLKRQSFGTNHLYVVQLDKLVADEHDNKYHPVSECSTESDEKFLMFLNHETRFPIRKFFTRRMQKFNTMNLTINVSSFIEQSESEKRSRRSVNLRMDKPEYLSCEKQQVEDVINVEDPEENEDIEDELEVSHDFFNQMDNSEGYLIKHNENIDSVINYVLKSKADSKEQAEHGNSNQEFSENENGDEIALDESAFKEQLSDSNMNSKDLDKTDLFKEIMLTDKIPMKGGSSYDLNRPTVYEDMQAQENKANLDFIKSAQIVTIHDMRKPVQLDTTHDMRKPVQVGETHDMRKSVKLEATHDMRKPVQRESTHDMRKPVTSDESHDLRWPVLEGENDLRNVYREKIDDDDADKSDEIINLISQNSSLDCNAYISLFSKKSTITENESGENKKQLKDLWEEASRVCGKNSGGSTEIGSSKFEEKWPWMVSLHENISGKYKQKCSAALLNSLWVITVAHCVDMKPKENIILVLGNQNSKNGKEIFTEREIDEIVIHPKFSRGLFENDLALLRMRTPVTFQPVISPICLPWNVQKPTYGIPVFLGWKQEVQRTTDDLQELAVPIMTNHECEILYSTGKYKEQIKDTFLCAGKDDRNCDSESGSSLITLDSEGRWSLIGLVSWGSMCTNPEQPGVYIRISSYSQWIKDVIDCYEILM